jgi:hypothetical protein
MAIVRDTKGERPRPSEEGRRCHRRCENEWCPVHSTGMSVLFRICALHPRISDPSRPARSPCLKSMRWIPRTNTPSFPLITEDTAKVSTRYPSGLVYVLQSGLLDSRCADLSASQITQRTNPKGF